MTDEPGQLGDQQRAARQRRANDIFAMTARLPEPERAAKLDTECGDDDALRAEVESLLAHATELSTIPGLKPPPAPRTDPLIGSTIGRYHIKSIIGSGGMGSVYQAMQEQPRRVVALKLMKRGITSRSALRRFEYESQILARLRHPGIAQIYEAGTHQDESGESVPFFAMEYIPAALPITKYAEEKKLGTRERLDLFARVCDAVQHGHGKGIIHRDLKPSNILVDSSGRPKVIDFGVARSTDSDLAVTTLQTDIGQLIGTLQYMSPEQCLADPSDLDTRSDVYALGVVLYELLCSKPPYDVSKAAVFEATRIIRESTPARPSTISKTLRGDVETVVMKALEKDRDRRYRSAVELGEDLRHYLNNEPISARPPSVAYQARMFAKKNRTVLRAGFPIILLLVIGVLGSTAYMLFGWTQYGRAESSHVEKEAALLEKEREAERANAAALAEREVRRQAQHQAYLANIEAADASLRVGEVARAHRRLEACPPDLRGWEWHYLDALSDSALSVLRGHEDTVSSASFSPDGSRIITASADQTARIWDATTGEEIAILRGHKSWIRSASFSPDGSRVVTASMDKTARIWEAATGKARTTLSGHEEWLYSASFSPDGTRVVTTSFDKTARIWDAATGEELALYSGNVEVAIWSASFSPDGLQVATASADHTALIWDATTGEQIAALRGPQGWLYSATFSPDGSRVVTASATADTSTIWDAATGEVIAILRGREEGDTSASFSPDGSRVVTASIGGNTARIWDAATGEQITVLRGHEDPVRSASFSPDGSRLVTASLDKTARTWDAATGEELAVLRGHEFAVVSARFSPDGSRVVTAGDKTSRIWDAATGEGIAAVGAPGNVVKSASVSPDGSRVVATRWGDKTARIMEADTNKELLVLHGHGERVSSASFSPDGLRVVTSSFDKTARIWEAATGEELTVFRRHESLVNSASFSPDGSRVLTASSDNTARIWDAATGEEIVVLRGHEDVVLFASFNPDDSLVVTASLDKTARIWDVATGEELVVLRGYEIGVLSAWFSPDGSRVVTTSFDPDLGRRTWDSVPYRIRFMERMSQGPEGETAAEAIDSLHASLGGWTRVANAIRQDTDMTDEVRRRALGIITVRAEEERRAQEQEQPGD